MAGAFVQDASNVAQDNATNNASVSQAFASNVVAGNLIVVSAACGGDTTASVTDSLGNTYTQKTSLYDATSSGKHFQFYAQNILGGACTVTVTWGVAENYNRLQIMEISGLDTTAPDDGGAVQVQAGGTSTDFYSSTNITTTTTDFIFGCQTNVAEATPGTGTLIAGATPAYTLRGTAGTNIVGMETLASRVAGTFDANFTRNTAHRCITAVMAFKEVAAGAAASPPPPKVISQAIHRAANY